MTLGNLPCMRVPFATTVHTLLTVSSVRVEFACSVLVAFIIADARRNRFCILSSASNTNCDRIESASFTEVSRAPWSNSRGRIPLPDESPTTRPFFEGQLRGIQGGPQFAKGELPSADSTMAASWLRVRSFSLRAVMSFATPNHSSISPDWSRIGTARECVRPMDPLASRWTH